MRSEWISEHRDIEIGGRKVVTLSRASTESSDANRPQFVAADILPGRGMNIFQIRANLPGQGMTNLLASPPLEDARERMNGIGADEHGNQSFFCGGAILLPFANRIRGQATQDGKYIETTIGGKKTSLGANWKGSKPEAERLAIHGMILKTPMDVVSLPNSRDAASVTAALAAGNFGGHWPSRTSLSVAVTFSRDVFDMAVTATNAGEDEMPIGIGWHPYFVLPSGRREQVRLKIPASLRTLVNDYGDVLPAGEVVPVADSPYDFSGSTGAALGSILLDDCFTGLHRSADGSVIAEIIDPEARFGLRVTGVSPEISAFQVYAPPDQPFVALEPQFNLADPFSPIWKGRDTGMKMLRPGESVNFAVRVEMFVP